MSHPSSQYVTQNKYIAQNMIRVHGLRAYAVVNERINESTLRGDTSGIERWQNVGVAISELRRTAPALTLAAAAARR